MLKDLMLEFEQEEHQRMQENEIEDYKKYEL